MADKLGVIITNCQMGSFKVDKNIHGNLVPKQVDANVITALEALRDDDRLTCASV